MKLLVWLDKIKLNFLLSKIDAVNQDEVQSAILSLLIAKNFKGGSILASSKIKYTVVFDSIAHYNKALSRVNALLQNSTIISPDWCRYDYNTVSHERFFTEGGTYVDKQREISEFVNSVTILRNNLKIIKDEQIGANGHNLRLMSRFQTHLSDLIVQLIRSSHEISLSQ